MKLLDDRLGSARALEMCARLAVLQHQPALAPRLIGAAAALRRTVSAPLLPTERAAVDALMAGVYKQRGRRLRGSSHR